MCIPIHSYVYMYVHVCVYRVNSVPVDHDWYTSQTECSCLFSVPFSFHVVRCLVMFCCLFLLSLFVFLLLFYISLIRFSLSYSFSFYFFVFLCCFAPNRKNSMKLTYVMILQHKHEQPLQNKPNMKNKPYNSLVPQFFNSRVSQFLYVIPFFDRINEQMFT